MLQAPPDRLTRYLVLGENILALAQETGEPITVLLDWLNSPPIAATLSQFRAAQDRARTEAALRTLERIHTESPDLTERRRAATTILRITRPAPATRPRQSTPRSSNTTRWLDDSCLDASPLHPPEPPPPAAHPKQPTANSTQRAPAFTPDAAFELPFHRRPEKTSSPSPRPNLSTAAPRHTPGAFDPSLAVMFPIPAFIPAPDICMALAPTLDPALSNSRVDSSLIALIDSS